jgi:hypothetical protein
MPVLPQSSGCWKRQPSCNWFLAQDNRRLITQGTPTASQNYSLSFVDGALVVTAPGFGVSPDKYIPTVLDLALTQAGPTPCDLAAIIGRAGSVVIFGPQASTSVPGEGRGCSAFSAAAGFSEASTGRRF